MKFVWDGNGTNFAKAAVKNSIERFGRKWLLLTNDYVWGHNTSAATRELVGLYGGEIVEEILVPQGTRDFSAALLKIQQIAPDVVAAAIGGDDQKALRQQVADLRMGSKPAWINNQQDWPDVYGLPRDNLFGVFGTTWYYKLPLPGVEDFVRRYQAAYPDSPLRVPGNVFYNGYVAMREFLRSIDEAGTTNNIVLIKALEGRIMQAKDRMQHYDAVIDTVTHQVQQTIYLATANHNSQDNDDLFEILANSAPNTVSDDAAQKACRLESYSDTPSLDF